MAGVLSVVGVVDGDFETFDDICTIDDFEVHFDIQDLHLSTDA